MHLDEKTSSQKNNSALPNLNKTLLKVKESIKSAESVFEVLNIRFALYDLNENLIYTSKNTEKIIGYSEEDFKLLSIFGYVHPDDREKVIKEFKKFRKTDFSDTINYRIFRPTGEMCWIRGAAHRYLNEKTHEHIATFIMEYDISEEKGKIPETIEEQKIYQEILELTKHPILYTKNFQIQWASKNWKDYFKYTDDFIRNKSIEFLFLDQDEYARYLFECNRDLKKNGFIEFEVKLQDSLKQCHLNRLSVVTSDKNDLSKGMVLSFVEITDQKNDEIARETSLSYYESIIANANIGILRIVDNKIEYFNQALLRQLDFKHDDLINQDLSVIFPTKENYKIFLSEMNKAFLNNENFEKQLNLIAKDRRPLFFNIRTIPHSYTEKSGYVLMVEPLNALREIVNSLREEKTQFAFYSNLLLHDMRNICQDAQLQIDLAQSKIKIDPKEAEKRLGKSSEEILRLNDLITNMDIFSRAKRSDFELETLDIYSALKPAQEKLIMKYEPRKIKFIHNFKQGNYYTIANSWLTNVFYNILDNAIKYDQNEVAEVEIRINVSPKKDDYWQINFLDKGPGIGEELKKSIFDRYERSSGTIHGSGFGLTLVKVLVDSYNGSITIEDRDIKDRSKGSNIILELPQLKSK